jgi:hypothetical protein
MDKEPKTSHQEEPGESQYNITMHRSSDMSEEERRRRLHQAYSLILSWGEGKVTGQDEEPDHKCPPTATETPAGDDGIQASTLCAERRALCGTDDSQDQIPSHIEKGERAVESKLFEDVVKLDLISILRQALPQMRDEVNRSLLTALLERYEDKNTGLEIIEIDFGKVRRSYRG